LTKVSTSPQFADATVVVVAPFAGCNSGVFFGDESPQPPRRARPAIASGTRRRFIAPTLRE
jgi:hypothetical protein